MVVDYTMDFTTNENFQSREALLNWAREVGKKLGFLFIIKSSNTRDGVKGRIILRCECYETYNPKVKENISTAAIIFDQQQKKTTGTKKCSCLFLLKGK